MANDTVSAEDIQSVVPRRRHLARHRDAHAARWLDLPGVCDRGRAARRPRRRDAFRLGRARHLGGAAAARAADSQRAALGGRAAGGRRRARAEQPAAGGDGQVELLIGTEDRPATPRRAASRFGTAASARRRSSATCSTFARHSALERSVADLNEIVRSTLALRAVDLAAANIAVDEDYADELPLIIVNREEIQQVGAQPAAERGAAVCAPGGGRDDARAHRRWPRRRGDVRNRRRRPWRAAGTWRAGSSSRSSRPKPVGEGTGLGLSVSLGIAEAHGGTLTLLPSARGARFALTLPMASIPALDTRETALTM